MTASQKQVVTPFSGLTKQVKKPTRWVDPSMMKVEHSTPIPAHRTVTGKYDDLFAQMKVGSCIVCEKHERNSVSNALRKHIKVKGIAAKVISMPCEDGHSRVWMVGPGKGAKK